MNITKFTLDTENLMHLGKRVCMRSAVVGSIIFALVEVIGTFINSIFFQKIAPSVNVLSIGFPLIWLIFVSLFGIAVTYFPARLMVGVLAKWLIADYQRRYHIKIYAVLKGGMVGVITVMLICLPILIFQYEFIQQSGHGDFIVFIIRTIEAVIIAFLTGGWSGLQLWLAMEK